MVKSIVVICIVLIGISGCAATAPKRSELPESYGKLVQNARHAYQLGDLSLAESLWRQALELRPTVQQGYCELGQISFRLHRYAEAESHYLRCLSANPKQPEVWHNLAALQIRQATEFLLQSESHDSAGDNEQSGELLKLLLQLQRTELLQEQ